MKTLRLVGVIATLTLAGAIAAAAAEDVRLDSDVGDSVQMFRASSRKMQRLFDTAYGYAVFPSVGKGAVGIGGAEGRGEVFERGALIGTAKLTQVTVGAQLGGQSYSEVIFFETQKALDEFREGKTALSAGLSAVVAAEGAGNDAKYQHGVLVCTMARSGLMFEASVGGQHFTFTPISASSPAPSATQAAPAGAAAPSPSPASPSTPPSQAPAQ
jgi:lipid-binding SYLF domain-containing protein